MPKYIIHIYICMCMPKYTIHIYICMCVCVCMFPKNDVLELVMFSP